MQRITFSATATEFLARLEWAKESGVALAWLGVDLNQAIQIAMVEAETDGGIGMPYDLDVDDDHAILCMLKWGVGAHKSATLHRLPPEGQSIYERMVEIAEGRSANGRAPRFSSWECWEDTDNARVKSADTLEEFQAVWWAEDGLLNREIEAVERLIRDGYHARGVNGDKINNRWGSAELALEALRELLDII
jgi:hypothetical protein